MWCGFRVVWFQALLAISIGSVDFVQNARANTDTVNGYSRVTVTVRGTTQQIGVLSYRPEGKGPFPIVLYSHGRGTREQRLALENPVPLDHVRYWIKKGFAVVAPIRIGYGELGAPILRRSIFRSINKGTVLVFRIMMRWRRRWPIPLNASWNGSNCNGGRIRGIFFLKEIQSVDWALLHLRRAIATALSVTSILPEETVAMLKFYPEIAALRVTWLRNLLFSGEQRVFPIFGSMPKMTIFGGQSRPASGTKLFLQPAEPVNLLRRRPFPDQTVIFY